MTLILMTHVSEKKSLSDRQASEQTFGSTIPQHPKIKKADLIHMYKKRKLSTSLVFLWIFQWTLNKQITEQWRKTNDNIYNNAYIIKKKCLHL